MHVLRSRRSRGAAAGAIAVSLVVALSGCAGEPAPSFTPVAHADGELPAEVQGQLQSAVETAMAATGSTGAIVGVWVPWSGSWVAGLGTAGPDDDTPVTTDMSFRIGDLTRLMTCDVLYALADRDVVGLDDPVTDYVNGVADMASVTLLDLCNGTGGVGSSETSLRGDWLTNPTRVWTAKEISGYGLEREPAASGVAFRDSDAGYMILGEALERATGKTAPALIAEYVAEPLGLEHTALPGPAAGPPASGPVLGGSYLPPLPEGAGLDCAAPVDVTVSSSSIGFTDSGAVSTIDDLGLYLQAEAAQALRTKEGPKRFGTPLPAYENAPSWYQATGGAYLVGDMIGQFGWAPGYLTAGFSDPKTGFTVAVVLNGGSAGSDMIAYLGWQLAALASKTPAAGGMNAAEFALPFTPDQWAAPIVAGALCPIPDPAAEEAPAGEEG